MIYIDGRTGSKELLPIFQRIGAPCEIAKPDLPFGDFAMDGNGPNGPITLGFERKTLHDMLACIEDSRYSAHQRPGMMKLYDKSFLIIEGCWKPHEDGTLMEGYRAGSSWGQCKYRSRPTMYSKLRRYLISVSLSGVIVMYTRDMFQTAYDVTEHYHYFSKAWNKHTSLIETQKLAIPQLSGKPSLRRRWASELTDIGVKGSLEAERYFKSAQDLANSDAMDWMVLPGIGPKTATRIIKEIRGK